MLYHKTLACKIESHTEEISHKQHRVAAMTQPRRAAGYELSQHVQPQSLLVPRNARVTSALQQQLASPAFAAALPMRCSRTDQAHHAAKEGPRFADSQSLLQQMCCGQGLVQGLGLNPKPFRHSIVRQDTVVHCSHSPLAPATESMMANGSPQKASPDLRHAALQPVTYMHKLSWVEVGTACL